MDELLELAAPNRGKNAGKRSKIRIKQRSGKIGDTTVKEILLEVMNINSFMRINGYISIPVFV